MMKFTKGVRIGSLYELVSEVERENWVYYLDKPLHPGFIQSMTLVTLARAIKLGILSTAVRR